jgi:hypothetical protein
MMIEVIAKFLETSETVSVGDGSKFMETLKDGKSNGKDFMESLKKDDGNGKSFMESLKEKDTSVNDIKEPEKTEKKGGSYAEVKENSDGATHEVHHMPADSVSELPRNDGPAIKMEKEDHRETASFGSSKEAQEYRQNQKELIEQGKFREAYQMDIDDIHEKFGDKYDDAIVEANEYVNKLEEKGYV